MAVICEACNKTKLSGDDLEEIEDNKGVLHIICRHCKKQSEIVLNTFDTLNWSAFQKFVQRSDDDLLSSDIPISKK